MRKLAVITGASRELIEQSDAEAAIDLLLREAAAVSLDASLFSDTAADDSRPAGILAGVSPLTASSATDKTAAMLDGVTALAGARRGILGPCLVSNPTRFDQAPP